MDWTDLVAQLIDLVESTAPALWEMARRQVVADTVEMVFWAIFFGVVVAGCLLLTRRWQEYLKREKPYHDDGYVLGIWTAYVIAAACVLIGLGMAAGAIKRLVSPDYYALRLLISMATGGN